MRPKQWTKNLLFVFPAIVFDGQLFEAEPFMRVFAALVLFCLIAGSVYIINDLADIESDRKHPKKRFRPLASGQLPLRVAQVAAVIIPLVSLTLALLLEPLLAAILTAYLIMQIAYSFALKHIVIIDVLVIMIGFIMRVATGVVVIEVQNFSPWLYATTGLLALFLAVGKRRQELLALGEDAADIRPIFKQYNLALLDEMLRVVTTSTLITYLLYTIEVEPVSGENHLLVTVPFVMYGLFHYLYLIHVRGEGSAPDEVLLKDRPLQITLALCAVIYLIILYVIPNV